MRDFPQYTPEPKPVYPLVDQAEERQHHSRFREHIHLVVAVVAAVAIVAIVVGVTYRESTATRAADAAAVTSPTAKPGPPVPQRTKPVEQSPKISEVVPGDGTWLVGREVKRATYRSQGGEWCFWERLRDLSGEDSGVMSKGFVKGPQIVAMGPDDVAFSSQGCGPWVMIP